MKKFSAFTSNTTMLMGLLIALTVGLWMFIGGIVDIIQSFSPFKARMFSFGLLKVLTCDLAALGILWVAAVISRWIDS